MSTLNGILGTAVNALRTHQQSLDVTAHNLANAGTEGYSRQRAVTVAARPLYSPEGAFGRGVTTVDVQHIRDVLLDQSARTQFSLQGENEARGSVLERIERAMSEPAELGLGATMDRFFSAWSELSTDPANSVARSVVRQRGAELVGTVRGLSAEFGTLRSEIESRLGAAATRLTELSAAIADMNTQIVAAESGGTMAPDLRDARGRALDEMSRLAEVQVTERANGSVGVSLSGLGIVDGAFHHAVSVVPQGATLGLAISGLPYVLSRPGGEVGGFLDVVNTDFPDAVAALDDIAAALVAEVNAIHETGTNVDGGTAISFFDPAGVTANSIALSAEVTASHRAIASGTPDGLGGYRAGANDVALALASLRDTSIASLGAPLKDRFAGLVAGVGQAVRSFLDAAEVHGTLAERADLSRMSLSGVSVDEELVDMIRFQTAYQAAARIITAADEMLETLLSV